MHRILFLFLCAGLLAGMMGGCKKQTPAEKKIVEINVIRDAKRLKAIEYYKQFAKEHPEDPRAAEATSKASALQASVKK
jgi:hypothetical protein